jgi:hypothetical protein
MLRRVALVRTEVLEKRRTSIIRVTRIGELGTMLPVSILRSVHRLLVKANVNPSSPILLSLMMEALCSSEASVFARVTWRNSPEDDIVHRHRRDYLKSYTALTGCAL